MSTEKTLVFIPSKIKCNSCAHLKAFPSNNPCRSCKGNSRWAKQSKKAHAAYVKAFSIVNDGDTAE